LSGREVFIVISETMFSILCEELGGALLRVAERSRATSPAPSLSPYSAPVKEVLQKPIVEEPLQPREEEKATPVVAEVAQASKPIEVTVRQPSEAEVVDPNYPRADLIVWLATRGFETSAISGLPRTDIEKLCIGQLKAINEVAPGVARRGRPPGAKNKTKATAAVAPAAPEGPSLMEELEKLSSATLDALAMNFQTSGSPDQIRAYLVEVFDNDVESLSTALEHLGSIDEAPVSAVVEAPQAPVVDMRASEEESPPFDTVTPIAPLEVKDVQQEDLVEIRTGGDLIRAVSKIHGYEGTLYNFITSAPLAEAAAAVESAYSSFGAVPGEGGEPVRAYFKKLGCEGKCLQCPRGGGQLAICASLMDTQLAHPVTLQKYMRGETVTENDPEGESPLISKVLAGELFVAVKATGLAIDDDTAGVAVFEVVE
jgi:hypothetical protein